MELNLPQMSTHTYAANTVSLNDLYGFAGVSGPPGPEGVVGKGSALFNWNQGSDNEWVSEQAEKAAYAYKHQPRRVEKASDILEKLKEQNKNKQAKSMSNQEAALRIVRVIVADPDINLPLANRVLHDSKEKITDLDDRELFFEINIKDILDAHNKVREVTIDKAATKESGKQINLEPIRIRDLKMTVVNIAAF